MFKTPNTNASLLWLESVKKMAVIMKETILQRLVTFV